MIKYQLLVTLSKRSLSYFQLYSLLGQHHNFNLLAVQSNHSKTRLPTQITIMQQQNCLTLIGGSIKLLSALILQNFCSKLSLAAAQLDNSTSPEFILLISATTELSRTFINWTNYYLINHSTRIQAFPRFSLLLQQQQIPDFVSFWISRSFTSPGNHFSSTIVLIRLIKLSFMQLTQIQLKLDQAHLNQLLYQVVQQLHNQEFPATDFLSTRISKRLQSSTVSPYLSCFQLLQEFSCIHVLINHIKALFGS